MWLLVVFFLFDPGQIRYRASVCLSSSFFYLLTHHNLYPPNEIPGYAPVCYLVLSCRENDNLRQKIALKLFPPVTTSQDFKALYTSKL